MKYIQGEKKERKKRKKEVENRKMKETKTQTLRSIFFLLALLRCAQFTHHHQWLTASPSAKSWPLNSLQHHQSSSLAQIVAIDFHGFNSIFLMFDICRWFALINDNPWLLNVNDYLSTFFFERPLHGRSYILPIILFCCTEERPLSCVLRQILGLQWRWSLVRLRMVLVMVVLWCFRVN